MISGEVLKVFVQHGIAGSEDQGGAQLERSTSRLDLTVSLGKRPDTCGEGRWLQRSQPHLVGSDNLGCGAILVEEHCERHTFIFDKRLGVTLSAGADGRDVGTSIEDFLITIADLTGPLTACQSAKVPKEQHDLIVCTPLVTEAMVGPIRVDEDMVGEGGGIKRHGGSLSRRSP